MFIILISQWESFAETHAAGFGRKRKHKNSIKSNEINAQELLHSFNIITETKA